MRLRARAVLVVVPMLAMAALAAPAQQTQVFRGGTDVVLLNVTVIDAQGHHVAGLTADDFQVLEDGVRQTITNFAREPRPIALSLVIDSSTSMEQRMAIAQQAAIGFVRRLMPGDVAQVIDFDSQPIVLQPFTNDAAALERAIQKTAAGGSTSLYNAVYIALSELRQVRAQTAEEIRRQAIVLLSDGDDTSSLKTSEEVVDLAKRTDTLVYAISLRDKEERARGQFSEADFVLRSLAQETGARAYFLNDAAELEAIYVQIADELANQYTIGYTSTNARRDGAWRKIHVKTTRPGTVARTKSGYFGPKAPR
jgi:Ca-activated chloride channel family protein